MAASIKLISPAGGSVTLTAPMTTDNFSFDIGGGTSLATLNVSNNLVVGGSANIAVDANIVGTLKVTGFSNLTTANITTANIVLSNIATANIATASINTLSLTGSFSGSLTTTGSITDNVGSVRSVPQNAQTSSYILVASDNGKHISITTGGVTINSGIHSVGDTITIFNNSSSSQTITQGTSVTLRQSATTNTGNRTLAGYGICTILCVAANTFVITGSGIT